MEIAQEITLERQAFEGKMVISNGLPEAMTELLVTLVFLDENDQPVSVISSNPDGTQLDEDVRFFHRILSYEGTPSVSGQLYTLEPLASDVESEIIFQIIPSPEAAGVGALGVEYKIGALITYSTATRTDETINVAPDFITVKPMPTLGLDYFLPYRVYGDEPTTLTTIEPLVPFTLGLRVRNIGAGNAYNLSINSGEPAITENLDGLAIEFDILGSEVRGVDQAGSLLADFGQVQSNTAAVARWIMTSSLSGEFTMLNVTVSHDDELGGEVTSLIENENVYVYTLIHDVLLDDVDSDNVNDFLATGGQLGEPDGVTREEVNDDTALYVYDSSSLDSESVAYLNDGTNNPSNDEFEFTNDTLTLFGGSSYPEAGHVYVKTIDPYLGSKRIKRIIRDDGKVIPEQNFWLSSTRDVDNGFQAVHELHLFDSGLPVGGASYQIAFIEPNDGNAMPIWNELGTVIVEAGETAQFSLSAKDPDGDALIISHGLLAYGMAFSFDGGPDADGYYTASISWTPSASQVRSDPYEIELLASDGSLSASQELRLVVVDGSKSLAESWMDLYGIIDFIDDADDDGISNLLEYAFGANPNSMSLNGMPVVSLVEDGGKYLALTFNKRGVGSGLTYALIASDDVTLDRASWPEVVHVETLMDASEAPVGFIRPRWRESQQEVSSVSRRFVALKVTYTDQSQVVTDYTPILGVQLIPVHGQTDNYISLPLQRPGIRVMKTAEVVKYSANSGIFNGVRVENASLSANELASESVEGPLYVEMISGPSAGCYWPIISNSTNKVFVQLADGEDLSSMLSVGDAFIIRPEYQLSEVLASVVNPVLSSKLDMPMLQGDAVELYSLEWSQIDSDPLLTIQQPSDALYTWLAKEDSTPVDRSATALKWGAPFVLRREQNTDDVIYLLGALPTADWRLVVPGSVEGVSEMLIGFGGYSSVTLDSSALALSGSEGMIQQSVSEFQATDELLIYDPSRKGYTLPPEKHFIFNGTNWLQGATGTDVGEYVLEPGSAFRVRRRGAASSSVWTPTFN
ncbi:hypothetical protein [Cerasicoccus maritimus]|uniref:hypothetical protein n=1 Tax=Cerasicoccus maritimus TaxID=490089 RepID=UPI002852A3C5|nr:hypothetical protein [Cerasicoccus maritimus]